MTSGPAPEQPARRLYREPDETKIAGVCGGLGDYLGVDPTLVRIAVVVFALSTWAGIAVYVVAALVIPNRPRDVPRQQERPGVLPEASTTPIVVVLLVLGVFALARQPLWFHGPAMGVLLFGFGVWVLFADHDHPRQSQFVRETATAGSAGTTTVPGGAGTPLEEDDPTTPSADTPAGAGPMPRDPFPVSDGAPSAGPQGEVPPPVPPWGPGSAVDQPRPRREREDHSGGMVVAVMLIVAGVVILSGVLAVVDISFSTLIAGLLLAIGGGMVVGSWFGRARWLVVLALPLIAVLLVDDVMDVPLDAGTGERTVVVDLDHLHPKEHQLAIGELTMDLRSLDPAPGARPHISAEVGLGQLVVIVPDDMIASVDARVRVGNIEREDRSSNDSGIDVKRRFTVEANPDGRTERPRDHVDLDLRVGMGNIEVRHD